MRFPLRHLGGEGRIVGDARLHLRPLRLVEYAQHVLASQRAVTGRILLEGFGVGVHRSRHALSLARLRRIQLFTVPSGVWLRVASSS